MQIINKITNFFQNISNKSIWRTKFITEYSAGLYCWNGNLYESDIIRACIRPFCIAVGRLKPIHKEFDINQQTKIVNADYIIGVLEDPNPYMSGQDLFEKLAAQYKLNNNAFAYLLRNHNGIIEQILPIPAISVREIYDPADNLYLEFIFKTGKIVTFPYSDILHLRNDFYNHPIFGDSPAKALADTMELVGTIDKGFVKAINNGANLKWLLKFNEGFNKEDLKNRVRAFVADYLNVTGENEGIAAATDRKFELEQLKPTDYTINGSQIQRVTTRLYNFFGINEKIIQSNYTEDEWKAYYEGQIEPFSLKLGKELSRKFFTRKERIGKGAQIVMSSTSLTTASTSTLLGLVQMVDRGALTPNEWRDTLNMPPIEGGDIPIRRLDTTTIKE